MSHPIFSRAVVLVARMAVVALLAFSAAPARGAPAPAGPEIYVSAEESGEIIVVDVVSGEVAARIPVGKRPRGVKLSRDGKLLYVALSVFPIIKVASVAVFAFKITLVVVAANLVGIGILMSARSRTAKADAAA